MEVGITPKKAGTKKKPKNSKIKLEIVNGDSKRTLSKLTITTPKTFKLSAAGLTKCDEATLESGGPLAARRPRGSARASPTRSSASTDLPPTPLTFDVTAVVLGGKEIAFYLAARELPVNVVAPGHLSGRKLTIEVPVAAQQPAPGTWAGLVSLETTLGAKKGKKYLVSTTGCKKKKHAFSTVMTFVDNTVGALAPSRSRRPRSAPPNVTSHACPSLRGRAGETLITRRPRRKPAGPSSFLDSRVSGPLRARDRRPGRSANPGRAIHRGRGDRARGVVRRARGRLVAAAPGARAGAAAAADPLAVEVLLGAAGFGVFAVTVYAGVAGTSNQLDNLAPWAVYVAFWIGVLFATLLFGTSSGW